MTRGKVYGLTSSVEEYINNFYITSSRLSVNQLSLEESLMFIKPLISILRFFLPFLGLPTEALKAFETLII